jgi:hypothetical protein
LAKNIFAQKLTPPFRDPNSRAPEMKTKKSNRSPELTRPLIARICAKVRHGVSLEAAAITCGVNRPTLHLWLRTADAALARREPSSNSHLPSSSDSNVFSAQEALYVEFLESTDQATAEADVRDMAVIAEAAKTDWRAAAWILNHWDEMAKQSALRGMPTLRRPAVSPPNPSMLLACPEPSRMGHQSTLRLWGQTDPVVSRQRPGPVEIRAPT